MAEAVAGVVERRRRRGTGRHGSSSGAAFPAWPVAAPGRLRPGGVPSSTRWPSVPPGALPASSPLGPRLPLRPPPDVLPEAPARARQLLEVVLAQPPGGASLQDVLVRAWLVAAAEHGYRLPHGALTHVLGLATGKPHLRRLVVPVVGERGRWLAGLDPALGWVGSERCRRVSRPRRPCRRHPGGPVEPDGHRRTCRRAQPPPGPRAPPGPGSDPRGVDVVERPRAGAYRRAPCARRRARPRRRAAPRGRPRRPRRRGPRRRHRAARPAAGQRTRRPDGRAPRLVALDVRARAEVREGRRPRRP